MQKKRLFSWSCQRGPAGCPVSECGKVDPRAECGCSITENLQGFAGPKKKLRILGKRESYRERQSRTLRELFGKKERNFPQRERECVEKEAVVGKLLLISNYRAQLVH